MCFLYFQIFQVSERRNIVKGWKFLIFIMLFQEIVASLLVFIKTKKEIILAIIKIKDFTIWLWLLRSVPLVGRGVIPVLVTHSKFQKIDKKPTKNR